MPRFATSWLCLALLTAACAGCCRTSPPPITRFGDLMAEVGRRFERAGRAANAGRWELVAYDVGELGELFGDDLPHAAPPDNVHVDVRALAATFARERLPALAQAAAHRDAAQFAQAFSATAAACNACHTAAAHGFIVVPSVPGMAVPLLAAVTPTVP